LENSFKANENVEQIDSDQYKITNSYKTQFKKKKTFKKVPISQEIDNDDVTSIIWDGPHPTNLDKQH